MNPSLLPEEEKRPMVVGLCVTTLAVKTVFDYHCVICDCSSYLGGLEVTHYIKAVLSNLQAFIDFFFIGFFEQQ